MATPFLNHKMREEHCRICGVLQKRAASLYDDDSNPPKPGDYHICIECGALSVYTETGSRAPTDAERGEALALPHAITTIRWIHEHREKETE